MTLCKCTSLMKHLKSKGIVGLAPFVKSHFNDFNNYATILSISDTKGSLFFQTDRFRQTLPPTNPYMSNRTP